MGFERFTGGRGYVPKISIRKNGQFGLSKGAILKYNLDKFKYIILYYDKETKLIGLEPTNNTALDGLHSLQIRPSSGSVSAKAFLDFFGIGSVKRKKYSSDWDGVMEKIIFRIEFEQAKQ